MKKLNLKLNGIAEMLTKNQMKQINGGYGSGGGGCGDRCMPPGWGQVHNECSHSADGCTTCNDPILGFCV